MGPEGVERVRCQHRVGIEEHDQGRVRGGRPQIAAGREAEVPLLLDQERRRQLLAYCRHRAVLRGVVDHYHLVVFTQLVSE